MEHTLTIEGDEAAALASELAELTGQSVSAAVTAALRVRVEAERRARPEPSMLSKEERMAKILALAAEIGSRMPHPVPTSDMSEFYDENGLPI